MESTEQISKERALKPRRLPLLEEDATTSYFSDFRGQVTHMVTQPSIPDVRVVAPSQIDVLKERGSSLLKKLSDELLALVDKNIEKESRRLAGLRRDVSPEIQVLKANAEKIKAHLGFLQNKLTPEGIDKVPAEGQEKAITDYLDYMFGGIAYCIGRPLQIDERLSGTPAKPTKAPGYDNEQIQEFLRKFVFKLTGTITGL